MSLNYLHKVLNETLKNGVREAYEETIIDGPKGLTIKMFKKDAKNTTKILITGKNDNFKMRIQEGENKTEKDLSLKDLLSELKSNKALKFAADFAKTQKGGKLLGGSLTGGRRASKKTSKKTSKRTSKRTSKKSSKKTSKRQ